MRAGVGRSAGWRGLCLVALICAVLVGGCGSSGSGAHLTSSTGGGSGPAGGTSVSGRSHTAPRRARRRRTSHRRRGHRRGPHGALAYSRASNYVIQAQPPTGSCHARGHGLYARPDPICTPGALNPTVTQATIGRTICVSGWTATVRPPESITEPEKQASLSAYGEGGGLSAYEYDHLVPLELGGATNDPRNLWPEPGPSPNSKDAVEYALREQVCAGAISLLQAQREIASDWVAVAARTGTLTPAGGGSAAGAGAGGSAGSAPYGSAARCDIRAAYSPAYGDYDVYVHSNQPDRQVTVSSADGTARTWHTDGSGYADVYFPAGRSARGERVTVRAGAARCAGTL